MDNNELILLLVDCAKAADQLNKIQNQWDRARPWVDSFEQANEITLTTRRIIADYIMIKQLWIFML